MSGIVGIFNRDEAPVDRQLLLSLTDELRWRGPDAQRVRLDGHIGFGHTLFATTDEAEREQQPATLAGDVWITADARVDAREDLVRELRDRGRMADGATDAELLLHAYEAWGERCVDHLLGDFAFAIWDGRERRLFCARDHFGVKPFYYACVGGAFVFSNTLNCVRQHPQVSADLNDLAIADFLLFYYNQTPDTTAFADIQRLPGGHTLTVSAGAAEPTVRRYWSLNADPELLRLPKGDYVEHFREVLTAAVRDRLRMRRVSVMMSGGVDSTALAAIAARELARDGRPFDLRAYTLVYDRLNLADERPHAQAVAEALQIPIDYIVGDDAAPYEQGPRELKTPEPVDEPFLAMMWGLYDRAASTARVLLTGSDGDTIFEELRSRHFKALARSGRYGRLASSMFSYMRIFRAPPPFGVRTAIRRWTARTTTDSVEFPRWMNEELTQRLSLRDRWRQMEDPKRRPFAIRPRAAWILNSPQWAYLFESRDPGVTGSPIEFRHPLTDLRVVNLALSLPVVPWCLDKTILREAMRGYLPEQVRIRKKTPLAGDPMTRWTDRPEVAGRLEPLPEVPVLSRFIVSNVPLVAGQESADSVYWSLRPRSLFDWLQYATTSNGGGVHDAEQQGQQAVGERRPEAAVPQPAGPNVRQHSRHHAERRSQREP